MVFDNLKEFLEKNMRMSHVYQPVMIRYLLANSGVAEDKAIATEISQQDPTQIEYYRTITNNMVGRVLRSHGIVEKIDNTYVLKDYSQFSAEDVHNLINLCNKKLDEYLTKRGNTIWEHRSSKRRLIPGSIKYEVLRRAHFRCELCGIMDSEKALEVDHIVPKNIGGENTLHNYQALCYSCNATKRDTDATDFRGINEKYNHRESDCIFCNPPKDRLLKENNLAYCILDNYPVSPYHSLIIPKRHFAEYFDIFQPELNAIQSLVMQAREIITNNDSSVTGFNIGVNTGMSAGQTVFHCHLHIIPRREGDVANPRGGIRGVIPGMANYTK